jgi:hypothetical protein
MGYSNYAIVIFIQDIRRSVEYLIDIMKSSLLETISKCLLLDFTIIDYEGICLFLSNVIRSDITTYPLARGK